MLDSNFRATHYMIDFKYKNSTSRKTSVWIPTSTANQALEIRQQRHASPAYRRCGKSSSPPPVLVGIYHYAAEQ
ncbi:hypothetical protein [Halotalea alkalilenta]|uniref:hypothetical protein n=1 Tax=Halotalea alkalilenta TaxID=376489 RepID=UPI0012DD8582|nr:hypothetical protein [Halotalea alkalilenta]